MSDVDVIVLDATGGGEMLRDCVRSIAGAGTIIVFDNGSPAPIRIDGARVIRSEQNIGFAAGVNEAYRHTTAAYVALINNDVVLDRDWMDVTREALDDDPKLAAVQTILRRDARTIDGAGIDVNDGTFRQIGYGLPMGSALPQPWGVSATATLYRRAALGDRVFDPRFFAYYEDVELCARLHDAGLRTAVLPIDKATHRGSASASILGAAAKRLRTRNRYFVARLHRGVGRISALLIEDLELLAKGQSSVRGIIEGLCSRL
ncbi:MAG TPA: glycosyltransferase [Thermoanaerobaculia bacterium]|nr:glycosyltransferase [Thermoanaerobaculia bacterium]